MSNPVDLSSLPEEERQQLQQLQERFEEHQQQQKQQQQQVPNHPSHSSGSSQVQTHPLYDQPYQPYYEYYPPYPAPVQSSLQHPPFPPDQQQQHYYQDNQLQHQPQHYYPTEHINPYLEHPNPHPQQLPHQIVPVPHPSAHLINLPPQPQSQHLPPPTGQVQVHHQQNVYYPQIGRSDGDQRQSGPLNPAAAAAVAALSQLVQFAGTMGDAERALAMIGLQASGVAGYGPPMGPSAGPQIPQDPVTFMPLAGQSMYMGGDTRGGGSSFPNKPHGKIRQRNGKGKIGPKLPPQPSSVPEGTAANKPQTPAAWCDLCKVECTSQEILKQHMIGKRHMKNLEKAATTSAVVQNNQNNNTANATALNTTPAVITDSETGNAQPQANEENSNNNKPPGTTNSLPGQKREPNHKSKGGKRAKLSDMQRRTFENPKPKVVVPLLCGLCNIKCDTQEVLNIHLSGKKHISKLRRYEAHPPAGYDQNRIQPLYHPNAPIGPPPPLHYPQAHLHYQQPYYPPLLPPASAAPPPFAEGNQNQQLG